MFLIDLPVLMSLGLIMCSRMKTMAFNHGTGGRGMRSGDGCQILKISDLTMPWGFI